jgi:predicted transcriptional regulator
MGCIQPDGLLTRCGEAVLLATWKPAAPEEVAEECGVPMFRVRSAIREFFQAGLVERRGEFYVITAEGIKKLEG